MSLIQRLRHFEKVVAGRVDREDKKISYTKEDEEQLQKIRRIPSSVRLFRIDNVNIIQNNVTEKNIKKSNLKF